MRFLLKILAVHCIACVCLTAAQGQGSRPISMRDAQRGQELQGQVEAAFAKGDYGQAETLAN